MSGIAGIFYRNGNIVSREELSWIIHKLEHRGIDGIRVYQASSIGLIQLMLHDTPESLFEELPYTSEDRRFTITFNGRIDNREELAALTDWPTPINRTADSILVLAAYKKWGESCLIKLLGDFAFTIWDANKNKLICGRDYIGIKPFFYYLDHNFFAFASEIKGLLALPQIPKELDENRIFDHLTVFTTDKTSTFYKKIHRLEPGCFLEIDRTNQRICKYSSPKPMTLCCKSDNEYEEQFRELFINAVKCRLRSAKPLGCYLSGGIDSSSIACIAARELGSASPEALRTFSGIFKNVSSCDERIYIDSVLKRHPIQPNFTIVDELKAGSLFDSILEISDEPFFGPHAYMLQALLQQASASGIQVILDGHDGDGVLSYGNNLIVDLACSGKIYQLVRELRAGRSVSTMAIIRDILRVYKNIILHRSHSYRFKWAYNYLNRFSGIISSELLDKIDVYEKALSILKQFPLPTQKEKSHHLRGITQPVQSAALESMDLMSAHHGIIPRYPFFDKRLVEFCLGLPASQKRRQGIRRSIIRRALARDTPSIILDRKEKTYFSPSVIHSFTKIDNNWIPSIIDSDPKQYYKYLDKEYLENVRKNVYSGRDNIAMKEMNLLITAAVFIKWLGIYFKRLE